MDVIVDYLWGSSAERLLLAGAKAGRGRPIRFVQVGSASGPDIQLPSAVLRSSPIELMGSGIGSVSIDRFALCVESLLRATGPGGFKIATLPVPLSQFESAWPRDQSSQRTVFTMQATRR